MSALGSDDSQNTGGEKFASQSDQPAGRRVLRPFSGELRVDEELKLSKENFKRTIYDKFKNKDLTPLSQLTATPPFPTPHVLAQFAYKAYTDYETGETDAQSLPDGWMLLTTASNSSNTNGYFGAAYWHPEHQQVVIAHRGSTNVGALLTDVKGVELNHYVPQMESASTFAHVVVEVLREVSQMKRVSFQLFFTGHSLGGWLAQVTTFTTEYLTIEEHLFLKSRNKHDRYHPHTVVFNSPGCKNMLSQMKDTFDVRLDGRSIALKHLDITSYLSAPNRINTSSKHVRTVYRIFPDLSDMGWWEKNTPMYDIATNNLHKIVQAFDPETGQVHKDEQGQLKMHVVVDWPVTFGLHRSKEYKDFFQWATHLNNYHPEDTDQTFRFKDSHPIRYQTTTYDERVCRLNVFCQEECQFLQDYHRLRQSPERFTPKELFCVIEDRQAQEEAGKLLQNFEIKNDTIRCSDASELQALIPYVRRLLQLFPEVKEETKRALSTDEVRKRVYQFETRRYVERISKSPLEFEFDSTSFREFLESEQQKVLHLQMLNGDERTGLIKVYQVLQKTGYLREGQHTVLQLERLLTLNQIMDLRTVMQSTVTPHLFLIACEDNEQLDEETRDVIRTLFETIKQKPNIKIIFSTRSGVSIVPFLYHLGRRLSGNGFVRRVEEVTWSDLTANSKEKLLEKTVKFQGAIISLNELMSAESPVAEFLPLGALLEEKKLTIADPVPISNGYSENFYIGRTFRHQKVVEQDILNDKHVRDSHVYLASNEQEYKQLCRLYPYSNVHWLQKDKAGNLLWQQSQGSLEGVRRYIDTRSSHIYTEDDLVQLLEQAEHQRVMLISDTAGMGKSTVLTYLSQIIKQRSPGKWVVRVDLNGHTEALKGLEQDQIDCKRAIEFVSEKLLKLKPGVEIELFKQCCEQKQKLRVVIMLDGFDEISPFYKQTVIGLLQALRQTAVEQLWVTTRPHLREELEDELQQLSYKLEPFSEENQIEFLSKFWRLKDWFTEPEDKVKEIEKNKLEIYAEHLINKLGNSISDKDREFTGIPLQTRMLAEAFDEEVITFYQSAEFHPELAFKLDLTGLYERFVERKYDIYLEEKLQVSVKSVAVKEQRERELKYMREDHQLLALKVLFTEEKVKKIQNITPCTFSAEHLARIGIVQVSYDGKPHFIHHSFADYFVADFFVNQMTEETEPSIQLQEYLLKDILLKEEYRCVSVFIDGLLSTFEPSEKVLKSYGNRISDLWEDCELVLYEAARGNNADIIGFVLHSLEVAEQTDILRRLLLAQDNDRHTAWQRAVFWGNIQVLEKLWKYAKKYLKEEDLNNTYLLDTDSKGKTLWHVAADEGNLMVLEKLWDCAKQLLTVQDLKERLLLPDNKGKTAWHTAAQSGNEEIVQKIWDCATQEPALEDLKNEILLAAEELGQTALHYAARSGNIHVLEKVWHLAEENLTTEDLTNNLLLAKNKRGQTAWHVAAECGNVELLQKIWEWAKEKQRTEEINDKMLLAADDMGRTAWHVAAMDGKLDVLEKIWDWAKKNLTPEEINDKLLLAVDNKGWTVWQLGANYAKLDVLQKVLEWAKENLTPEEINNKLLLAADSM